MNDYLNKSNLSNSINFLELPMEKINEYIKLLENFQLKSEKEGKFVEAELARQRVIQLKNVQDKKRLKEAKLKHIKEREDLEKFQKEELNEFNMKQDKEFYELSNKFSELQNQLESQHQEELSKFQEEFESRNSNTIPKPSSDLINANKKLELFVKKKDYPNAHLAQIEIAALSKKEQENFELEKEKRMEKEIENLKQRQKTETQALEQRIQNNYNSFKRERAIEVEKLLLKYKNKFRELENNQKQEIAAYERAIKQNEKKTGNSSTMYSFKKK